MPKAEYYKEKGYNSWPEYKADAEFRMLRRDRAKAAKQLGYPPHVVEAVEKAKTEYEISRIMSKARERMIDDELCDPRR